MGWPETITAVGAIAGVAAVLIAYMHCATR